MSVAELMGLSREDATALNRAYLSALGRIASEDGVVTSEERADLESVASMLGLTADDVESAVVASTVTDTETLSVGGFVLKSGDAVVFTGDAPGIDRADLEYQARSLGLRPTGSVSGKTNLVVAADPDSLSGKARKARDLGVPIVGYDTYLLMLGRVSPKSST